MGTKKLHDMKKILMIAASALVLWVNQGVKASEEKNGHATVEKCKKAILHGEIKDISNLEGLAGAEVMVKNTGEVVYCDFDGTFTLNLQPGKYTLVVNYISYEEQEKTIELKAGEKDIKLQLKHVGL